MAAYICPNCRTIAGGQYCPTCGQRTGTLTPTLIAWFGPLFDELFFVNGKVPATLRRLLWPPGELTREWRQGRRARYLHPFRVYLLAAATYFLLAAILRGSIEPELPPGDPLLQPEAHAFEALANEWWPLFVGVVMVPAIAGLSACVHRGRTIVEHSVFSLHFHSLIFVLWSVQIIAVSVLFVADAPESVRTSLGVLPFPLAATLFAVSTRRSYEASWPRSLVASAFMCVAYVTAFFLFFVAAANAAGWTARPIVTS